jgi:hypothetical protein
MSSALNSDDSGNDWHIRIPYNPTPRPFRQRFDIVIDNNIRKKNLKHVHNIPTTRTGTEISEIFESRNSIEEKNVDGEEEKKRLTKHASHLQSSKRYH